MRLVDASAEKVSIRGKWSSLVLDFIESGLDVAEIKDMECSSVAAYRGIIYALKKGTYPVRVMKRGERVFLTRVNQ